MNQDTNKPTAFVIQSFDGGKFDRRYDESIRPAITRAGATPLRADQILGLQPIIQKIENAIQDADICIAEVSMDNPNVWLELGYALALNRPTIILCDRGIREKLPFDVQHRPVIFYNTDSKSGFDELEDKLSNEIRHAIESSKAKESQPVLLSGAKDTDELRGYEISILAALLTAWSSSPSGSTPYELERTLGKTGYSDTELAIGLSRLNSIGYIEKETFEDRDGNDYFSYRITPNGIKWIHENEGSIQPAPPKNAAVSRRLKTSSPTDDFTDDDIPF